METGDSVSEQTDTEPVREAIKIHVFHCLTVNLSYEDERAVHQMLPTFASLWLQLLKPGP